MSCVRPQCDDLLQSPNRRPGSRSSPEWVSLQQHLCSRIPLIRMKTFKKTNQLCKKQKYLFTYYNYCNSNDFVVSFSTSVEKVSDFMLNDKFNNFLKSFPVNKVQTTYLYKWFWQFYELNAWYLWTGVSLSSSPHLCVSCHSTCFGLFAHARIRWKPAVNSKRSKFLYYFLSFNT